MEDSKENNQQASHQPNSNEADRMEIEEEEERDQRIDDIRHYHLFQNILFDSRLELENINQLNINLRLNKFYNQSNLLSMAQSKVHSGLPSDLNKIYYRKAANPNIIMDYDKTKPYMKITVMRSNPDSALGNQLEYILTPQGMVKSEKNTDTEDLIIGRHQATAEEIKPNDIVLPPVDRAISRIHCKIIYKNGFVGPKPIPDNFLSFLMMGHHRLGAKSPGRNLPTHIYRLIFQYAKNPKKFYIADIGSVFGTYLRIKPYQTHLIEKGQAYLVGAETLFHITEKISKKDYLLPCEDVENKMQIENEKEEFYKYLAYEKKNGVQIHGLDESEQNVLETYMNKFIDEGKAEFFNETQSLGKIINRPMLRLDFQSSGNLISCISNIFVGSMNNQPSEFKIGRAQDCQIVVNHNTISRKQCKIKYINNDWFIHDGDINKESANGTWISLTDYRVKKDRIESDPKEIENESEIKISDSILKIEIKNNE